MRTVRLVTAALVAGSASFGFVPLALAGTTSQTVAPTAEAWFQGNPTCGTPAGCVSKDLLPVQPPVEPPAPVPTSPWPAGTLHVAVAAGIETARSYLSFPLSPGEATVSAATLDVPLDTAPTSGSMSPEAAKVLVCSFFSTLTPSAGSLDTPPDADCSTGAEATYVATPAPHLHADLGSMHAELEDGAGLVLLPDATKAAQTDVWHLVFSAHDRADAARTAPAALALTLTEQDAQEPAVVPPATVPEVAPPLTGPIGVPLPTTDLPQTPDVTGPAPTVPVAPVPQARTITVGYAYPAVWLLPLAFLVLVPLVARTLTKDLTPVRVP